MGKKNKVKQNKVEEKGENYVILITGGTSGLGLETAKALASKFSLSTIIVSSRSGGEVVDQLKEKTGNNKIVFMPLDLSSQENVREFATKFISSFPPVSHLIMNAGIQILNETQYSPEGIEKTFATNHIGHFLLYQLLKNHMTPDSRITVTASGTHDPELKTYMPHPVYRTADEVARPPESELDGYLRYTSSKLCNVLFTYELARRFRFSNSSRSVNSICPGLMPGTALARDQPAAVQWIWHSLFPKIIPLLRLIISHNVHSISDSGFALARLAAFEETKHINGKYFEGLKEIRSSLSSYDEDKQKDLWDASVRLTARNEEEVQIFSLC